MKILNSISFYIMSVMAMVMILNENVNRYNFIGFIILGILFMHLKNSTKEDIFELLGINWLQNKLKNSELIMNMTNE